MSSETKVTWKHIYIAGPMRKHPEFNFPAFDAAAKALWDLGWTVYSPADANRSMGFDPTGCTGFEDLSELENFDHSEAMANICEFICLEADALYVLDGWQHSLGATAERALALALGLPVHQQRGTQPPIP